MSIVGCGAGLPQNLNPNDFDCDEADFIANCLRGDAEVNAAAWIDAEPQWVPSDDWIRFLNRLVRVATPQPERLTVRLRLRLPGGHPADELRLSAEFRRTSVPELRDIDYWFRNAEARVTALDASGLRRWHTGTIDSGHCEMQRAYVAGLPSELAERVAVVVRAIAHAAPAFVIDEQEAAQLIAAINPHRADADRCISCGRVLRDEVSKAIGIGPDCARFLGVPHTLGEAGRALQARATEVPRDQK